MKNNISSTPNEIEEQKYPVERTLRSISLFKIAAIVGGIAFFSYELGILPTVIQTLCGMVILKMLITIVN
jgi:hypothetical protein